MLLETDDDLDVGEFGIATRMVAAGAGAAARRAAVGARARRDDGLPADAGGPTEAVSPEELGVEREHGQRSTVDGKQHELDKRRTCSGARKECDIQLADPNVSRRHAELRQEGAAYWIVDLGSTNGIEVNGRRLKRAKLEDGDPITLGSTELVFRRETA